MRQSPAALNRSWLAIIGVLLLLGAAALVVATAGLLDTVIPGAAAPENGAPLLDVDPAATAAAPAVLGGAAGVGVLLALLGLAWLAAQVPRRRRTRTYRLHGAEDNGLVTINPTVLEGALNADIERLPGVEKSRSVLRGSSTAPDVTIRTTVDHRASIGDTVRSIRGGAVERLAGSLEAMPRTVAIIVDVSTSTSRTRNVTQ
ncbi:hypothetical protein [Arthrobacter bussei]|uniref:Alkaline shock response membrane anchor protein AmaP n=1 Tax=Arthrobacter bussei TaxID=2594179 RepID=A0A7X1NS45_9MICC|nr:hypothetical protein [Arthrobacter bussei]MPY12006.1 hypothetical protein [Arthrobacter bussei]